MSPLVRRGWPLMLMLGVAACQRPVAPDLEVPVEPAKSLPASEPAPVAAPTHPLELVPADARRDR